MKKPRTLHGREAVVLLLLGALCIYTMHEWVWYQYRKQDSTTALRFFNAALFLYPACLLGFIRKAMAKHAGDYEILLFTLGTNWVLLYLLCQELIHR